MKLGFMTSLAALVAGSSLAVAQAPVTPGPTAPTTGGMTTAPTLPPASPGAVAPAPVGLPAAPVGTTSAPVGMASAPVTGAFVPAGLDDYLLWARGEFLLWKISNPTVPLVSISSSTVAIIPVINQLLDPDLNPTQTQLNQLGIVLAVTGGAPGGQDQQYGYSGGFRTGLGVWLDAERDVGFEALFHYLAPEVLNFASQTNQLGGLNFNTGLQNVFVVPADVLGQATTFTTPIFLTTLPGSNATLIGRLKNSLWGVEGNVKTGGYGTSNLTFEFLAGFRFEQYRESLLYNQLANLNFEINGSDGAGDILTQRGSINISTIDDISTINDFYGAQIGTALDWFAGPVFVAGSAKLAVGGIYQTARFRGDGRVRSVIDGQQFILPDQGGLFISPINEGSRSRGRLTFIPEFDVRVGLRLGTLVRLWVGYNWLMINNVLRPAEQIAFSNFQTTITVGGTTVPVNVNVPTVRLTDSLIWYQGGTFGLEFRF
ncbi:MAG: BBP7 family outer membrane beta-barrel protein [Gemmataceae bacterium]|nr:BBP7 family outer membrane beta-barrel protein [Gemmataceae bacterium]MDW8264365.1 BBP7 family outer membrane beta-barrel protein [Gemmataceae bacterium]